MEQKILDGDILGAIQVGTEELAQLASSRLQELINISKSAVSQLGGSGAVLGDDGQLRGDYLERISKIVNPTKQDVDDSISQQQSGGGAQIDSSLNPFEKALTPRLGKLLRKPLLFRSILDGRAVGEWHITIGNPMNPMAMIGNLVLDNVACTFNETLGLDDFPTEVTFTVTLKHGRPRAKQDIESIFNLGNGAMTFSELPDPSSAGNSYGEYNTAKQNAAKEGISPEEAQAGVQNQTAQIAVALPNSGDNQAKANADTSVRRSSSSNQDGIRTQQQLENLTSAYRSQVERLYGKNYGDSPILVDYFTDLKTKD
jgi:hypothetical protein